MTKEELLALDLNEENILVSEIGVEYKFIGINRNGSIVTDNKDGEYSLVWHEFEKFTLKPKQTRKLYFWQFNHEDGNIWKPDQSFCEEGFRGDGKQFFAWDKYKSHQRIKISEAVSSEYVKSLGDGDE